MKTALSILKRDLLALAKNPIALLVVGALLVLPGLYAWYCIIANWDPYSNTGNMPIAVVNHDRGAESELAGEVNIGKQVTEKLEDNDSIGWRFYDSEEEALRDTELAYVYATLVLPEDLSERMLGTFTGGEGNPTIYYYPNEKYNAVATKVTDSAAQTLIRQINQGFSATVNEKLLDSTQKISSEVEQRAGEANKSAIAEIRSVQDDLDKVLASLDDADSSIAGWRDAAAGTSAALGATAGQLPGIAQALSSSSQKLDSLNADTDAFESELSGTILRSASAISEMSGRAATALNNATADLKAAKSDLEGVKKAAGDTSELTLAAESLDLVITLVQGIVDGVDSRVSEVDKSVQEMTGNVTSATTSISEEVVPQLSSGSYKLAVSLSKLSGAIGQFEPQIAGLQNVLAQTDTALVTASGSIAEAKVLLSNIGQNLKGTVADIGAIGSALEIEEITELLDVDPENVGSFVSMPVEMVTEKVFPVSNYGTAVAPFYTNLALWIGCFILVSLMKVEVNGFSQASTRQRYFGRLLLFVLLSLLQSQVICGVDLLLGIDCGNPGLFMLAGAVCSFAYMNLIYALVKTFRNIGKTLCIFLLIMQVPGSSGMYPIQMMPGFFQAIHPALPFTYGIDAMREALSGLYGLAYVGDLLVMLLIVPGALLVGLGLRRLMFNLLLMFDEEMNKAGFFASEEYEEGMQREGVRGIMRALVAHGSYADDIEERAWRFNRSYPRWRKVGSVAAFAIPFAVVVFMLPFNVAFDLSTDTKLTVLIIMLVALLVVMLALIVLEYTHRSIREEARLLGASILGEDWQPGELPADVAAARVGGEADEAGDELEDAADEPDAADVRVNGVIAGVNAVDAAGDELDGPGAADEPGAQAPLPGLGMVPATRGVHAHPKAGGAIRDIFTTDMKLGFQSVIGVVVIILLVITPSMYAWFNIAGSWNPYGSTGNLKVAVANEDEGYKGELVPITVNIGETVVSQLRGNSGFDWVFVDADDAVSGVESSAYYAAIVIPSDFSANMMTYLTDDTEHPDVVYYTNEKENPIAPIITQKGADSIQENIRVSFTERVDQVVLTVAYDVLGYVERPGMSAYAAKMGGHLDDAVADAKSAARELHTLSSLSQTVAGVVDTLDVTLDGVKEAGDAAGSAIGDAEAGAKDALDAFDKASEVARDALDGRSVDVDKIRKIIDSALALLEEGAELVPDAIQERIDEFDELADEADVSDEAKKKAEALEGDLTQAKEHASVVVADVANAQAETASVIESAESGVDEVRAFFNGTVSPSIDDLRSTLQDATSSASDIAEGLKGAVAGIDDSTEGLSNQLGALSEGLGEAGERLEAAAEDVEGVKERVTAALNSGDVEQIEQVVLGGDPEVMAQNLAAPVEQHREALYPVANYGSAMAPFYTVLSLWVGALVMISTMRVHIVEERVEELRRRFARLRPRHEFFGRYGIFGFIGLLQSALVLLGDLLLLHIQCENPVMFFLCGIFIGQVFCLMVYTLTELFGDVGKALCVILLIMQVAASGGTFPVEMLDPLLINFVPFLPFNHGMTILQECVAGILWPSMLVSVLRLLVLLGVVLLAGVPLRRPFRKVTDFFEEQLEKTGYM